MLGLATSCEKANDLGLELPGTSPISSQFLDLPVATYTVRQQPVETINSNQLLVGRLRDTKVGTTTAQAYLNLQYNSFLSPVDSLPSKFTGVRLDSVVFSIGFDKVYGTASQPLRFDLGVLQQPLDERTVYNSTSVPASSVLLTNLSAPLNRSVQVKQRTLASSTTDTTTRLITTTVIDRVVRLRLLKYAATTALANSVFSALQSTSFNQERLDAIWKGIALTPSTGFADNVVAFNRSYNSRVIFYFTGTNASGYKSKFHSYSLVAGPLPTDARTTGPKYFTQLTTDFSGTPLASLSSTGQQINSSATDGYTYLQEGTGLATRLELQGLATLMNNTEVAVNRAELLLPIKQNTNALFPYPTSVYLYEVNASNEPLVRTVGATSYERLVQVEGAGQNGQSTATSVGNPAAATLYPSYDSPQYYSVPLTEYLQAYLQNRLDGELPSALLLSPILRTNPNLTLNRAQLDTKAIKLRVYYSKLR
ncbi:DUF4270 family protein [Hymenobacter glacieicola]|uniref:DUF4270 domain-containing protein n=1 Tax=Hymenobacter glacieicola TaxID=1562124 RepID=A0ABQ1WPV6_9BACT|nr:DUF4270 family protein [Hymenobacter glacieicola]GGG40482.1 hypothetical protein GCM10011378_15890 [Hymenobacter glacieicola]